MDLLQKTYLVSIIFVLLSSTSVNGQGCCSGGTPLSGNLDIAANPSKTLSVRLTYDNNKLQDLLVQTKELEDKTRTRLSNSVLLRLNYSLNKRIAFTSLLTYSNQIEKVEFQNFSSKSQAVGLGDIVFFVQYNFINSNKTSLSSAVGIKAPTGRIDRANDDTGLLLPPDLQPGTGALDYLFSSQYARKNLFDKNLNFQAGLTYRLATPAERFNSQQIYKFGNEFQFFAGMSNSFYIKKSILTPQLTLRYRHTGFDETNEVKTANTGGHWTYLSLSSLFSPNSKISFFIQGSFPLYRNLDGVQLTTSYRITTSVSYAFTFKEKLEIIDAF